jgi:hypothetical protein
VQELLGTLGGAIVSVSACYYLIDVLRGRTRPQRTSWGVWALVGVVGFGTADSGGAGPGAYSAAADAFACAVTFVISLLPRFGKPGGRRTDLLLAGLAVAGLLLWQAGPLPAAGAAACAVGCDAMALWPTVREAWRQPELESMLSWSADLLGNALCVAAVARASAASIAFPAYLVGAAAVVVAVLTVRRGLVGMPRVLPPGARNVRFTL